MDEKVVNDRANQVLGAAAASVMFMGNGVRAQQSVNLKGNELDAYNKAVSAMESIGASKIFQDMETYSKTDSIGTANSESHAYTNNRSAAFNEAKELLGSVTDSYSKLDNIQDQYNEMRKDDFGITTQLTGDFNDWYREKYGDSTDKYYEGMTNNQTGEQLVYEYMSDRVFNGEERFGAGPGIGAKEQAMDAGLADSGIGGVQFEEHLQPDIGMSKDGIKGVFTEENDKLSKAFSAGGQAFYIEPKDHTEAIQNKGVRLEKDHNDHKEVAGFNEAVNRHEIDAKEGEVRHYKDNIMSEEIGKPLGLDKIREEVNDHTKDPSWGAHKTEKETPGIKAKKDKK